MTENIIAATKSLWPGKGVQTGELDPDPTVQAAIIESIRATEEKFGDKQATNAAERLREAITIAGRTKSSEILTGVMNLRNKHWAHHLEQTHAEKQGKVTPMKFGDEKKLLNKTISVVEGLHLSINGAGFSWNESREIARKNAAALWDGCRFEVLR